MNLNHSPLVFDILSFIKYTDEYDENFMEEKDYEKVSLQSGITVGIFDRQYFDKTNKLYHQKTVENPFYKKHYTYKELLPMVDELYSKYKFSTFKCDVLLLMKKEYLRHYDFELEIDIKSFFVKSDKKLNTDEVKTDSCYEHNINYIMKSKIKEFSSKEIITITNVSGISYSFESCVKIIMHLVDYYGDYKYLLLNYKTGQFINELIELKESNKTNQFLSTSSENMIDRDNLEMYEGWLVPKN